MVRHIVLLGFMFVFAFSDAFDDKIRNLMGEENYQLNANFIQRIFSNRTMYYINGRLDIAKIIQALKSNGLLISRFGQPREVRLSFSARTSPILLAKITNNLLTSMGYSYFLISKAEFSQGLSNIEFSFNTEHNPDLGIIIDEIHNRGFVCLDVSRLNTQHWEYILEVREARLPNTKFLSKNTSLQLREVSGEYWLNVNTFGELKIQSVNAIRWNPRIVLYDKNLNIAHMLSNVDANTSFKMRIPQGVKFIMITDYDNQETLKGGILVSFN